MKISRFFSELKKKTAMIFIIRKIFYDLFIQESCLTSVKINYVTEQRIQR